MVTTDPIADLFTRIRNGYLAGMQSVDVPHSKLKESVLSVLSASGFVGEVKVDERQGRQYFVVALRYDGKTPALTRIERVSKPGRRTYVAAKQMPSVLGGLGIAIVSTPEGVMTGAEARRKQVGGEFLGRVW